MNSFGEMEVNVNSFRVMTIKSDLEEDANIIGQYKLGKVLGRGTYGVVKLATHVRTDKKVAIKIIEKKNFKTERQFECIRNEIEAMKTLNHKNIVQLYEVIESTRLDATCLVMEYLEGGELFDYIVERDKLCELESSRIFIQIIKALEFCHANNIIHRDIKPENILISKDGKIKLSDFGLSVITDDNNSKIITYVGSTTYSSPEVLLTIPHLGQSADVWSLGVTLYTMVTGNIPWQGFTPKEQTRNIVRGNYFVPEDISPECATLLARMIQPDPVNRGSLAEIKSLAHEWRLKLENNLIQAN